MCSLEIHFVPRSNIFQTTIFWYLSVYLSSLLQIPVKWVDVYSHLITFEGLEILPPPFDHYWGSRDGTISLSRIKKWSFEEWSCIGSKWRKKVLDNQMPEVRNDTEGKQSCTNLTSEVESQVVWDLCEQRTWVQTAPWSASSRMGEMP